MTEGRVPSKSAAKVWEAQQTRERMASCPSGKKRFDTEGFAAKALAKVVRKYGQTREVRSYYDPICGGWHLTKEHMAGPRIVSPEEAREVTGRYGPYPGTFTTDSLAHTVATEPDRTRAAVLRVLRQNPHTFGSDIADAIENGEGGRYGLL